MVKRRNVKSTENKSTNAHEKEKDHLSDSEIKVLLGVSKKQDAQNDRYQFLLYEGESLVSFYY